MPMEAADGMNHGGHFPLGTSAAGSALWVYGTSASSLTAMSHSGDMESNSVWPATASTLLSKSFQQADQRKRLSSRGPF